MSSAIPNNAGVPSSWDHFEITWTLDDTPYEIRVENPNRLWTGVFRAELDGTKVDHRAIPLLKDGKAHVVKITMGKHW